MSKNIPSQYCTYTTLTNKDLCVIQNTCPGDQDFAFNKYYFVRKVDFHSNKPRLQPITSDTENDNRLLPFNIRDYVVFDIAGYTNIDDVICPVVAHAYNTHEYYAIKDGELKEVAGYYKEKLLIYLLEQYHENIKSNTMSNKIVVNKPEEFYTLQNLTNSNLVVILYKNKKRDTNGNEVKYKSITHHNFYVAEKSSDKLRYTLHTMDDFDRNGNTGYIAYNKDSRFIEYQIEGYILDKGLIYPVIKYEDHLCGIVDGNIRNLENLEVTPVIWDKKNPDHIKHILKMYHNIQYGKDLSQYVRPGIFTTEKHENLNPCCEIALPTQPMKAPEPAFMYCDFKYDDTPEVNDINWIPTAENVDTGLYTGKKPYKIKVFWSPAINEANKITWIPKHDITKNELTKINF